MHIVNGDCAIEALKDSGIEGDFFPGWMCFMMGLCQKDLVWRNYLRFVKTSLRIVIGQYMKKRRMLFQKRDIVFRKCHEYDEVVLWNSFELFDQLHTHAVVRRFCANEG